MRNMHPADELAMIRTDIRKLRAREEFLCKGFLSLRYAAQGVDTAATVKIVKERRLRQDQLPTAQLNDPTLWETKVTRHVHLDTMQRRHPYERSSADMAGFELIEQF